MTETTKCRICGKTLENGLILKHLGDVHGVDLMTIGQRFQKLERITLGLIVAVGLLILAFVGARLL